MRDKLALAAMVALFIVAGFFMAFGPWLAQILGYYLLLIDGIFAVVFVVLVRWLKVQNEATSELEVPDTRPLEKP